MSDKPPVYCNPDAYNLFAEEVPKLDTTDGFLRASIAVAMHALDDVIPEDVDDYLLALATRVRARARSDQVTALVAHLHEVLFVEEGFAGDNSTFYLPLSSYVPAVCVSRRGNPVTLAAIYKVVAVRTGLFVQGLNSPGRFLVRVRGGQSWLTVDPFDRGRVLSQLEAVSLVEGVTNRMDTSRKDVFRPATHALWLSRIIANLESILSSAKRYDDLAAMQELHALLRNRARELPFHI
jgi:regulator of sirC expression with transglutaminase-like and TPR domain